MVCMKIMYMAYMRCSMGIKMFSSFARFGDDAMASVCRRVDDGVGERRMTYKALTASQGAPSALSSRASGVA